MFYVVEHYHLNEAPAAGADQYKFRKQRRGFFHRNKPDSEPVALVQQPADVAEALQARENGPGQPNVIPNVPVANLVPPPAVQDNVGGGHDQQVNYINAGGPAQQPPQPPPPPPPPQQQHDHHPAPGPDPIPSHGNQQSAAGPVQKEASASVIADGIDGAAASGAGPVPPSAAGSGDTPVTSGTGSVSTSDVGKNISNEIDGLPSHCPPYEKYATVSHPPLSKGKLRLPFQRPQQECRTFQSPWVEKVIAAMNSKIADPDLARLFENCFPNTLDTTIRWHTDGPPARTFVVTGDINAEWIRDAQRQLLPYIPMISKDERLKSLVLGTINQYAEFLYDNTYCNAFYPPKGSNIPAQSNQQSDTVYPNFNPDEVFECKYELDSLSAYFALANQYYGATQDSSFVTQKWLDTSKKLIKVIRNQQEGTFDADGNAINAKYSFQRHTDVGSETLILSGQGNPVASNTSLVRSAFRPSDDATIFQLFIPANAQVAVELQRTHAVLSKAGQHDLAQEMMALGKQIEHGVWEHGTHQHHEFGKVFAYEVDGFGGIINMDDANLPSLLSLPDLGFCDKNNQVYKNTRRMLWSKSGNPYYLTGKYGMNGIGGPHAGIKNAWPMSHFLKIRTTDDDNEIKQSLELILKSTNGLGLMHESVHVDMPSGPNSFTRPWFAWANSEFSNTILDLADRKPHLIFKGEQNKPWTMKDVLNEQAPVHNQQQQPMQVPDPHH